MDSHVQNGFDHGQFTLCTRRRNFIDFDPKIVRIHAKCKKMNDVERDSLAESVQTDIQKLLKINGLKEFPFLS